MGARTVKLGDRVRVAAEWWMGCEQETQVAPDDRVAFVERLDTKVVLRHVKSGATSWTTAPLLTEGEGIEPLPAPPVTPEPEVPVPAAGQTWSDSNGEFTLAHYDGRNPTGWYFSRASGARGCTFYLTCRFTDGTAKFVRHAPSTQDRGGEAAKTAPVRFTGIDWAASKKHGATDAREEGPGIAALSLPPARERWICPLLDEDLMGVDVK